LTQNEILHNFVPKQIIYTPNKELWGEEGGDGSLAKFTWRLEVVMAPSQEMDSVLIRTKLYLDRQTESLLEH